MLKGKTQKKGIVLFIVLATLLIVIILANVILSIIASQSRLTRHQVARIKAYYAAQAGMNLAFEKFRTGEWSADAAQMRYYCINGNVDAGVNCAQIFADPFNSTTNVGIPYNVQIGVYPNSNPGIGNTTRLDIKVDYTYTP